MLGDKLANDKKQIDRLMRERQVLLTTIAHGIKTPVVNIKLYASAIATGLYQPEEGFYFTIRNKGNLIPEKEISYVFNSFWRGSNAEGVEGSGIGLFEAKTIASRLGGNIFVKNLLETKEVEFVVFVAV